jgi:hypothetical protein
VARPGGELDWTTNFDKDARLGTFVDELVDSSDTLLLGRKLTPGFIGHWENVARQPNTLEYHFAQKMVRIPKIVFSKTMHRDGGAAFVSSLIQYNLIDELNFSSTRSRLARAFASSPRQKA